MRISSHSKLPVLFFLITLIFQATAFKYIWGLESISRLLNVLMLLTLNVYFLYGLASLKVNHRLWFFYLLPGLLVYIGMSLNIGRNSISDPGNLSLLGLILPWVAYLSIPKLMKQDNYFDIRLWSVYYYFMLFCVVTSLYEHYQLFFGSGLAIRTVETSGGTFGAGMFSLFFMTLSGDVEFRIYGAFLEPGTFGMFLIPAIAWAFLKKRYIGMMFLLFGLYKANSLGVFVSLFLLPITMYVLLNKRVFSLPTMLFLLAVVIALTQIDFLQSTYESKGNSRTTRTENIINGVAELPAMLIQDPIGFKFDSNALGTQGEGDASSSFSTFMPIYYFVVGGVVGFLGYLTTVVVSLFIYVTAIRRRDLLIEEKTVFACLLPMAAFLIQRTTIWESAIFAFLFAPTIIRHLSVQYRHGAGLIKHNCDEKRFLVRRKANKV